jgi:hypothetical protein
MDWLAVSTIMPQAPGPKACVPSDMGGERVPISYNCITQPEAFSLF